MNPDEHVERALTLIGKCSGAPVDQALVAATLAQAHATLALVALHSRTPPPPSATPLEILA